MNAGLIAYSKLVAWEKNGLEACSNLTIYGKNISVKSPI